MEDRKEHGLDLKVGNSDGGARLNTRIPKTFPDICIQLDVFYKLRPVDAELSRLEKVLAMSVREKGILPESFADSAIKSNASFHSFNSNYTARREQLQFCKMIH